MKIKQAFAAASLIMLVILVAGVHTAFASSTNGTIPTESYAWGENLGWINFGCAKCNVSVTDSAITGYAWSDQYGWVNLSPAKGGVTNDSSGDLGGTAWSSGLGWIDFSGASIDSSGQFSGTVGTQGSTAGRINFNCLHCGVTTDWRPASVRNQSGSNNTGGSTSSSGSFIGGFLNFLFGGASENAGNVNATNTMNGALPSAGRPDIAGVNGNKSQNPSTGIGIVPAYPLATGTALTRTASKPYVPNQLLTPAGLSHSNAPTPLLLIISGVILLIVILTLRFLL